MALDYADPDGAGALDIDTGPGIGAGKGSAARFRCAGAERSDPRVAGGSGISGRARIRTARHVVAAIYRTRAGDDARPWPRLGRRRGGGFLCRALARPSRSTGAWGELFRAPPGPADPQALAVSARRSQCSQRVGI